MFSLTSLPLNMPIGTDPQLQESASPHSVVIRSFHSLKTGIVET
jgi:hypothetical protein